MRERRPAGQEARSALLDAIRGVKWPALRPVAGALPGAHHSRLRGSAPELSEYRVYRQGDDPRRIDWRLLARSDRVYIRLAEDRSVVSTLIVVDATASMAFPVHSLGKWKQACDIAVGLAAVAHAGRDPVGLVIASEHGMHRLPPRTRRGIVGEVARALDSVRPAGTTSVASALGGIGSRVRVAIVSDFLGDAEELRRRAGEVAAAGGEVHAIHIVAEEELDPPAGSMLAVDPEDRSISRPFVAESRAAYLERFAAWRSDLAAQWRADGLSYTLAPAAEQPARVVRRVAGVALGAARVGGLDPRAEAR
jgi:uncharacterized protein (DUF58 family)